MEDEGKDRVTLSEQTECSECARIKSSDKIRMNNCIGFALGEQKCQSLVIISQTCVDIS